MYLGKEGYVAYAAIYAISLAPQAFVLRHGPRLTGPNAILFAKERWQQIRENLWSAVTPTGVSAICAGAGLALLYAIGWIDVPAVVAGIGNSMLVTTLVVLVVVNLLNTWVLVFDDMQGAFQETHVQGIRITLGNIVALLAIMFIVPKFPTLLVYAIAITLPPLVFRLANVGLILIRYRQINPRRDAFTVELMRETFRNSFMYTLVVGVGTYASFRLPVVAAAQFLNVDEAASISILNQFVLVGYVFGQVLSVAFVPAINASIAEGDSAWILRSMRRLEYLLVGASVLGTIAFCALGPIVHRYFVKEDLHVPDICLLFAGIYTALMVIENFYYLVCLSFRPSIKLGLLYVLRAVATGIFVFVACAADFPAGIWIFGSVLTLLMTVFVYRHSVYGHLNGVRQQVSDDGEELAIAAMTK